MTILREQLNSLCSTLMSNLGNWMKFLMTVKSIPPNVKLTLLQTAVKCINDLQIVETLDEFQSTTHGHGSLTSLSYQTYYDLLINACVRYDKTKKANIGKRRNVYNTNIDSNCVEHPTDVIDYVPDSFPGGIDLNRILSKVYTPSSQDATMMVKDSILGSLLVLPVELWKGIAG